ncbi:MAG: hydrogenase formation protein HypD [Candidatus Omnitrophica bacterium]|nr:hydrogenase formation protein HypD [Candidatus Omnitrophota bacterium]
MKYIDEYRDKRLIKILADEIKKAAERREYRFMEVCGTHTMAIARFGLKALLPPNVRLLSGPGCPVCVTPTSYIDKAISYSGLRDVVIATFGDMVNVPGSRSSLREVRSERGNVKIVYSALDALGLAVKHPDKKIVFLGIGFETTAPTIAAAIKEAKKKRIKNFFVLCGHKVMPPALKALISDRDVNLDGFILPAHVSAIIGSRPYGFISKSYKIPCVIAGFEPLDIMQGIYMLIRQVVKKDPIVEIQYDRVVRPTGNRLAQLLMKEVFKTADSEWRGIGVIPASGLAIKKDFRSFNSEENFKIRLPKRPRDKKGCICGEVLKGKRVPTDCRLFGKGCTPGHPVGPCMVSSEGACSAYFMYK